MTVVGTFIATAYGPPWGGIQGGGTTATGVKLPAQTGREIIPIVAVDPSVIPLHSRLKIWPNPFGDPNLIFQAEDTGGAIKGNRIDFLDMYGRAHQDAFGRRPVSITVVGTGASQPPPTIPGSSATSSPIGGGGGPSPWIKLLLDVVFVGVGAAAVYRGGRRMIQRPQGAHGG